MTVQQAWATLANACADLRTGHYQRRGRLFPEQLWTGMSHVWARAGWTLSPKLLKESITASVMADNLGAALQYSDRTSLYVCCDMHRWYDFRAIRGGARSALLTAYWTGADGVYVENTDWMHATSRHPDADPGALLDWNDPTSYTLTSHGGL